MDEKNNKNDNNNNNNSTNNQNDVFLNLPEKIYSSNVILEYKIDYLIYKKELVTNMANDINIIINFFSEEISDIIIGILILKKKNKINDDEFKIFLPIYNFIDLINQIDFFDQEDFLIVLINLFGIKILTNQIKEFGNNFKFQDVVNLNYLTSKINNLFNNISKNNLLLKMFDLLISSYGDKVIGQEIKSIAKTISIDFFMYYNANNIYNKILNNFIKIVKDIIYNDYPNVNANVNTNVNANSHSHSHSHSHSNSQSQSKSQSIASTQILINDYKTFINVFKKHKDAFVNEYNIYYLKHLHIYLQHEIELKIKFKFRKNNDYVNKLVENLNFIKNID